LFRTRPNDRNECDQWTLVRDGDDTEDFVILFAICVIWYRIEKGGAVMMQLQREQLDTLRVAEPLQHLSLLYR
jgi:hypothetical protein